MSQKILKKSFSSTILSSLCNYEISKLVSKKSSQTQRKYSTDEFRNMKKRNYIDSNLTHHRKFSLKNLKKKYVSEMQRSNIKIQNLSKQQPVVFNIYNNQNQTQSLHSILDILRLQQQSKESPLFIDNCQKLKVKRENSKVYSPSQFKSHCQQIISGKTSQVEPIYRTIINEIEQSKHKASNINKISLKKNNHPKIVINDKTLTLDNTNKPTSISSYKEGLTIHENNIISNDSDYIAYIPQIRIYKNNLNQRLNKIYSPFNKNLTTNNTLQSQANIQCKISFLKRQNERMSSISNNLIELQSKNLFNNKYGNTINIKPIQTQYNFKSTISQRPIQKRNQGLNNNIRFSLKKTNQNQNFDNLDKSKISRINQQ